MITYITMPKHLSSHTSAPECDINKFPIEWRELINAHLGKVADRGANVAFDVMLNGDTRIKTFASGALDGSQLPRVIDEFPSYLYSDGSFHFLYGDRNTRTGDLPYVSNTTIMHPKIEYKFNNKNHRYLGPAIEGRSLYRYILWYINGTCQRKKYAAESTMGAFGDRVVYLYARDQQFVVC